MNTPSAHTTTALIPGIEATAYINDFMQPCNKLGFFHFSILGVPTIKLQLLHYGCSFMKMLPRSLPFGQFFLDDSLTLKTTSIYLFWMIPPLHIWTPLFPYCARFCLSVSEDPISLYPDTSFSPCCRYFCTSIQRLLPLHLDASAPVFILLNLGCPSCGFLASHVSSYSHIVFVIV